jgi:transcription elongation factor Elf1
MGNSCIILPKSYITNNYTKRRKLRHINLLRYKCIYCGKNGLIEKKLNNHVWANCTYCNQSGYRNRINDNINVSSLELVLTLHK